MKNNIILLILLLSFAFLSSFAFAETYSLSGEKVLSSPIQDPYNPTGAKLALIKLKELFPALTGQVLVKVNLSAASNEIANSNVFLFVNENPSPEDVEIVNRSGEGDKSLYELTSVVKAKETTSANLIIRGSATIQSIEIQTTPLTPIVP